MVYLLATKVLVVLVAVALLSACDKSTPAKPKVTPGAYCQQAGQHGTYRGADYICSGTDHPRWRKVS